VAGGNGKGKGAANFPVNLKIVYSSGDTTALENAYRLLALKVWEAGKIKCGRPSI